MGGTLSHLNNKLSFDFDEYTRERDELAGLLREIAKAASTHRQQKGTMMVINGASGVAASVVGVVALATAPVTFGMTTPVAIVGHSIAAASLASSAASYGYGHVVDKDVALRLQNLQYVVHSIVKKDEEINTVLSETIHKDNDKMEIVNAKACSKLKEMCVELNLADKKSIARDLPVTLLSSQGIVFGTRSIIQGSRQIQTEEELEEALTQTADNMDKETEFMRKSGDHFKYLSFIPGEITIPRGRLTYIDGGGGCSRVMVISFFDVLNKATFKLESDSSNVIRLPEGVTEIKAHFQVKGGKTVKKVDRSVAKQPWIKSETGEYETDVFDFDLGDGVDAVFVVQGSLTHSYVSKAWDFGRHPTIKPRSWEFWENAEEECKKLVPDIEARALSRAREDDEPYGIIQCGSCFGQDKTLLASVA